MWFVRAYILAGILLFLTLLHVFTAKKKKLLGAIIGVILMLIVLFFPLLHGKSFSQGITVFFRNIYRTIQIFGADSEYVTIQNLYSENGSEKGTDIKEEITSYYSEKSNGNNPEYNGETPETRAEKFLTVYNITLVLLFCVAPLTLYGFVLSFSLRVRSYIAWALNFSKETYFFSKPSVKALQFAQNIRNNEKDKKCCVFCNTGRDSFDRVLEAGGIPFNRDITSLGYHYFDRRQSVVFFMSDRDEDNMDDYLRFTESISKKKIRLILPAAFKKILHDIRDLIGNLFKDKADSSAADQTAGIRPNDKDASGFQRVLEWFRYIFQKDPIIVYVVTKRPEAALLLDSVPSPNIICRRIPDPRSVIYRELINEKSNLQSENQQKVHILLVGCGFIGSELLKALLWIYARRGRSLSIDVIASEDAGSRFRIECPGFFEKKPAGTVEGPEMITGNPSVEERLAEIYRLLKEQRREDEPRKVNVKREFMVLKEKSTDGEPEEVPGYTVTINFYNNRKIQNFDITTLSDPQSISRVYIAAGDDSANLEYALYLRKEFNRMQIEETGKLEDENIIPLIKVAMTDPAGSKLNLTEEQEKLYRISLIGGENGFYTVDNIIDHELEQRAARIDFSYTLTKNLSDAGKLAEAKKTEPDKENNSKAESEKDHAGKIDRFSEQKTAMDNYEEYKKNLLKPMMAIKEKTNKSPEEKALESRFDMLMNAYHKTERKMDVYEWHKLIRKNPEVFSDFYKSDYKVGSSVCRAVYNMIYDTSGIDGETEHMRWHVYMLTEGFEYSGKMIEKKSLQAKLHKDMVSYKNLKSEDRIKDESDQYLVNDVINGSLFS